MTCDKGSTLQEATSGSTNLLGLICGCKYCFQIPKASHQSSIGESKILGNDDFVANTLYDIIPSICVARVILTGTNYINRFNDIKTYNVVLIYT